jgi:PTS system mannose-specific IIA component
MATGIKETAVNIMGNKEYFEAIEVYPEDGIDGTIKKLEDLFIAWENLDGILVFVDMFGGTPCNSVARMLKQYKKVDVITGVNLPMILSSTMMMSNFNNVEEMAEKVVAENQKAIFNLRKLDIFKNM